MRGAKFDGKPCRRHPDNTIRYVKGGQCIRCVSTPTNSPQHIRQKEKAKRKTLVKRAIKQFESW